LKYLAVSTLAVLAINLSPAWGKVYSNSVPAGIIASSQPVVVAGGGDGAGTLTINSNQGKFQEGANTSLVITPTVKPSTGNLMILGSWIGASTFTSVVDNRGNVWVQDKFDDRVTVAVGIWHHIATATLYGTYTITLTSVENANINAGLLICSNTVATASVDVTTSAFRTTSVVEIGTSTVTSADTDVVFTVFVDNSGANDTITPRSPTTEIAEEENGTSFQPGGVYYSTTSVAGVATSGNINLDAEKTWNSITVAYKTP
jgi:hypothetical protein